MLAPLALRCGSLSRLALPAGLVLLLALARPAAAQESLRLSGLAYLDGYYHLTEPEGEAPRHGFTYRRLFLTAGFTLSETFSGLARLEANENTAGPGGTVVFVKDLFLTGQLGGGHALTFGIGPTPAFGLAEQAWGYRALERTLADLHGAEPVRDFGLRLDGPLAGALRYALMLGNGEGVLPERNDRKRVYGQLAYRPEGGLTLALSGNYARLGEEPWNRYALIGLAGYVGPAWRAGVEAFLGIDDLEGGAARAGGVSLFGAARLADEWALVARVDRVEAQARSPLTAPSTHGIVGLDFHPHPQVHLIPNVGVVKLDAADKAAALARATLWFSF